MGGKNDCCVCGPWRSRSTFLFRKAFPSNLWDTNTPGHGGWSWWPYFQGTVNKSKQEKGVIHWMYSTVTQPYFLLTFYYLWIASNVFRLPASLGLQPRGCARTSAVRISMNILMNTSAILLKHLIYIGKVSLQATHSLFFFYFFFLSVFLFRYRKQQQSERRTVQLQRQQIVSAL